jgi:TatD DNase family protein
MYIDAHTHLDKYGSEIELALAEIEQHAIFTVSVSMEPTAYAKSKAIEKRSGWVVSTFGVHPWDAPAFHSKLETLIPLIDASPMIGEIGLDYYFVSEPEKHALQRDVFQHFARHGVSQNKILNIHSKGAEADVDRILGDIGARRVILHWYAGPLKQIPRFAEKGFYFTVGIGVLFSNRTRQIAKTIPADLLLTETDNPVGYQSLAGKLGTPSIICSVVETISELRGWSIEETKSIVRRNFLRLTAVDDWAQIAAKAVPESKFLITGLSGELLTKNT